MTLAMMSSPLARVYIRARFPFSLIGGNLTAQSTGSHRETGGGIQIPETYLQALLSFPAPQPERPGELARRLEAKPRAEIAFLSQFFAEFVIPRAFSCSYTKCSLKL